MKITAEYTKAVDQVVANIQVDTEQTKTESPAKADDTAPQQETNSLKQSFQSSFAAIAKDPTTFHKLLSQAFGANYDRERAETIRQDTDFSWLPQTKLVDALKFANATQNGAKIEGGTLMGAFDGDSVLLNKGVLPNSGLAKKVYAEEVGHALDKALNPGADSAGDEGAIFQKLLSGETISTEQMAALRAENDHGKLEGADVEFYYGEDSVNDAIDWVSETITKTGRDLVNSFDDVTNWAGQAWDGLGGFTDDVFGAATDWADDFGDDFFTGLGDFGDDILTGLDEFGTDIADFGDDLFTDLGQFGSEFFKDIGAIGTDVFNGITDIDGGEIIDSIVKFGEGIVEDVEGFGKTIFGTIDDVIIEPVGNFAEKVAQSGESLVKLVNTDPLKVTTSEGEIVQLAMSGGVKLLNRLLLGGAKAKVDPNKIRHIFGQARHKLDGVVKQFGSQEKAFNAIQQATETAARSQGLKGAFETTVKVGTENITVRGNVIDGVVKIGTAFKP